MQNRGLVSTGTPSTEPTDVPSAVPTDVPSALPTDVPSGAPTNTKKLTGIAFDKFVGLARHCEKISTSSIQMNIDFNCLSLLKKIQLFPKAGTLLCAGTHGGDDL